MKESRIVVLHPGTDIPGEPKAPGDFRKIFNISDRPLLLSVGRLTRRKGLAEFVERALPTIVENHPGVTLAVIGGEAENALHGVSRGQREHIIGIAAAAGVEKNVRFLERCDDDALRDAYRAADCHVFPVLAVPGDVEGFGMVAIESAAHGLPTVAFAVGGVQDAVDESASGILVNAGDYDRFGQAVMEVLSRTPEERIAYRARGISFSRQFAWPEFRKRLFEILSLSSNDSAPAAPAGLQP